MLCSSLEAEAGRVLQGGGHVTGAFHTSVQVRLWGRVDVRGRLDLGAEVKSVHDQSL